MSLSRKKLGDIFGGSFDAKLQSIIPSYIQVNHFGGGEVFPSPAWEILSLQTLPKIMSAMLLFENDKNGARQTQSSGELILVLCKRFLNFCCQKIFN